MNRLGHVWVLNSSSRGREELDQSQKRGVCEYFSREGAQRDPVGKKVKWAQNSKGTEERPEVRCRRVAQELGYGEMLDELFVGTPSLSIAKVLLSSVVARDLAIMILDVRMTSAPCCTESFGHMCISGCPTSTRG